MSLQWQVALQQQQQQQQQEQLHKQQQQQEGGSLALLTIAPHHQVMEDLLEEWCVSGGHPYDLDVTSL